jgi:regulator of protease activity HflC (stomatin/prohibitin superfamily)
VALKQSATSALAAIEAQITPINPAAAQIASVATSVAEPADAVRAYASRGRRASASGGASSRDVVRMNGLEARHVPRERMRRSTYTYSSLAFASSAIMAKRSAFPALLFFVIIAVGGALMYVVYDPVRPVNGVVVGCVAFAIALIVSSSVKVAAAWDRAVVLRLGRFRGLSGPGVFLMVPIIDTVAYWLDTRVITTGFKAEKTLTKDTVPVDVDAVLFWKVIDPEKAALAVADYASAISWASQTALRDIIGKTMLADMLEGRDKISAQLQEIIDQRTEPWGVNVISVEVRDVLIPPSLENAMSMQAQAERERQARVILGDSERQVAEKFGEAARTYAHDPIALHLRAMNMLYEGLKQNSTIVIVPSSAVESMQLGGLAGLTALTMGLDAAKATGAMSSSSESGGNGASRTA